MRDVKPHLTEEEIGKINNWDFSGGYYSRASLHLEKCSSCRERIIPATVEDVKRVLGLTDQSKRSKEVNISPVFEHLNDEEIKSLDDSTLRGDAFINALSHLEECDYCCERVKSPRVDDLDRVFQNAMDRADEF